MDRSNWDHYMNYYQQHPAYNGNNFNHSSESLRTNNYSTDVKHHVTSNNKASSTLNSAIAGSFHHQNGMMVNYPVYPANGGTGYGAAAAVAKSSPAVEHVNYEKYMASEVIPNTNNYYNGGGSYSAVTREQSKSTYYESCSYAAQSQVQAQAQAAVVGTVLPTQPPPPVAQTTQTIYNADALYQRPNRTDWKGGTNCLKPTATAAPYAMQTHYQNPLMARTSNSELSCNNNVAGKHHNFPNYVNNYHLTGRPAEPTPVSMMNLNYPPYAAEGHEYPYLRQQTTINKPVDYSYDYYNQQQKPPTYYQPTEYARASTRPYYNHPPAPVYHHPKITVDPWANLVPNPDQRSLNYVNYQHGVNRIQQSESYHTSKTNHIQQTAVSTVDQLQYYYGNGSDGINPAVANQSYQFPGVGGNSGVVAAASNVPTSANYYNHHHHHNASQPSTYTNRRDVEVALSKDVHHFYSFSRINAPTTLDDEERLSPSKTLREFLTTWNDVDDEEPSLSSKSITNLINNSKNLENQFDESINDADITNINGSIALSRYNGSVEPLTELPNEIYKDGIESSEINNNVDEKVDESDKQKELSPIAEVGSAEVESAVPDTSEHTNFHLRYIRRNRLRKTQLHQSIEKMSTKKRKSAFNSLQIIMFLLPYLPHISIRKILSRPSLAKHSICLLSLQKPLALSLEFATGKHLRMVSAAVRKLTPRYRYTYSSSLGSSHRVSKHFYHESIKRITKAMIKELSVDVRPLTLQQLCLNTVSSLYTVKFIDSLSTVCALAMHKSLAVSSTAHIEDMSLPLILTEDNDGDGDDDSLPSPMTPSSGRSVSDNVFTVTVNSNDEDEPTVDIEEHTKMKQPFYDCFGEPVTDQISSSLDVGAMGPITNIVENTSHWYRRHCLLEKYKQKHTKLKFVNGFVFYRHPVKKKSKKYILHDD